MSIATVARRRPGRVRVLGLAAGSILALLVVVAGRMWTDDDPGAAGARADAGPIASAPAARASAGATTVDGARWLRSSVPAASLPDRLGVRITHVALTGGGGLVDLRFRVVDPDRAAGVHSPVTPPAVIDEVSGVVVDALLMNHAHSGPYNAGETYYLVFENPGNLVQRGDAVTVLLGDVQVEHVRIE